MVRTLGPAEADVLIAQGDVAIIDVREPHEWATGHLPGARHVPLGQLRASWDAAGLEGKILFVCQSGARSMTAAKLAETHGLTDVYSLEGGTPGWGASGRPIVRPAPPAQAPARAPAVEAAAADAAVDSVPELDAVVGANLKELRAQRGLTLDVLAGLSGVGRQTLGQIELGHTVPSLGTLWKIARALDVPFSGLLVRPEPIATRVLRKSTAKRLVGADGRFSSRALFPIVDKGKVEFYELWLAAHGREDAEAHAPGTRENLVVTAGHLALEIGGERHELEKGDAIVFAADVPHAYINPASEECWMNLVMTYAT
jgi:rhodanese-related sulfurtransferase/transcriptional regulator with XRE-family HTH domain